LRRYQNMRIPYRRSKPGSYMIPCQKARKASVIRLILPDTLSQIVPGH
jgi:hypothetical protein